MPESLWNRCLRVLEGELPEQQFNTWVRPLQAVERDGELRLLAPNRYVIEWLGQNLLPRIKELILAFAEGLAPGGGAGCGHESRGHRPSSARRRLAQ